jgi:glycosyltransferase involved in cell wall biosynthesis
LSPILSVIIVTANDHKRFLCTLDSITNIQDERIQIIFVFPETDRKTLKIIADSNLLSPIFCFDKQAGIYSAMNLGLEISSSEYSLFLNSGDTVFSKQNLLSLISVLEKSNCDWCLTTPVAEWRDKVENTLDNLDGFIHRHPTAWISHQAVVFRNSIINQLGRFDLRYKVAADTKLIYQFWLRSLPLIVDLKVSEVEVPFFSSLNHRKARLEVAKIVVTHLQGFSRLLTIYRIVQSEVRYALHRALRRKMV